MRSLVVPFAENRRASPQIAMRAHRSVSSFAPTRLLIRAFSVICPTSASVRVREREREREKARMLAFEARQLISQRGLSRFFEDGREQKGTRVEDGLFLAA